MTAQAFDPINIRTTGDHVEVDGLSQDDVQAALDLYRAVVQTQLDARESLSFQVNEAFIKRNLPLISEASQRQVLRNTALREELLEEGFETYSTLADLRDSNEKAARTWVARQRDRKALFTVELKGRTLIPDVQLTGDGNLDPAVSQLTKVLVEAGLDSWGAWEWLTDPTGRLSGAIPAEVAHTNLPRALRAAERYAADLHQAQGEVA